MCVYGGVGAQEREVFARVLVLIWRFSRSLSRIWCVSPVVSPWIPPIVFLAVECESWVIKYF